MANGTVVAICIGAHAGAPMLSVDHAKAIAGKGLAGDRYSRAEGSFNKGQQGKRQVTLMNARFFERSDFEHVESRRNIIVRDVELMWLIGRTFEIGEAIMRGIKYCDPCMRPSKLAQRPESFMDSFQDCGGLVVEVLQGGVIRVNDSGIPPAKGY